MLHRKNMEGEAISWTINASSVTKILVLNLETSNWVRKEFSNTSGIRNDLRLDARYFTDRLTLAFRAGVSLDHAKPE